MRSVLKTIKTDFSIKNDDTMNINKYKKTKFMKKFFFITFLLTSVFSFGQSVIKTDTLCKVVRKDYAVQIASTVDINVFIMQPSYKEVFGNFETEKVCMKDGSICYRILIPVDGYDEAKTIQSYYKKTRNYKDAFIVTYIDGKRLN